MRLVRASLLSAAGFLLTSDAAWAQQGNKKGQQTQQTNARPSQQQGQQGQQNKPPQQNTPGQSQQQGLQPNNQGSQPTLGQGQNQVQPQNKPGQSHNPGQGQNQGQQSNKQDQQQSHQQGQQQGQGQHYVRRHRYPVHHGSYYGHGDWTFVVPQYQEFVGTYYTVGPAHFYTTTPVYALTTTVDAYGRAAYQQPGSPTQNSIELAFGGFARHGDLAARLAFQANALCLDLHYNHQQNPNFQDVYRQAYALLRAAQFLQATDHRFDRERVHQQLATVDRTFRHLRNATRTWSPAGGRLIGASDLAGKVAGIEAIVGHLSYQAGVRLNMGSGEAAPPPSEREVAAPPDPEEDPEEEPVAPPESKSKPKKKAKPKPQPDDDDGDE